jgi:hypothetical protein
MLISKGISAGQVVSIKLITGEEIIARLDEENSEVVKLSRPLSVNIGPQGLGMMPFVFLADSESMTIKQQHIVVMSPAKKDAADQYLQGTTGIALR